MILKKCVIFDIDGTVANLNWRLHHVTKKPKNWKAFMAGIEHDEPIEHIKEIFEMYRNDPRYVIIFLTGRDEQFREKTVTWLAKHGFYGYEKLYMRPDHDDRRDDIVKVEMLKEIRKEYNPVIAFEDRLRVAQALRKEGLLVCHVADGDF